MTPQEWLQSERDYEVGRQLLTQLLGPAQLLRTLAHGPSKYNTEALAWELTKLARAGAAAVVHTIPNMTLRQLDDLRGGLSDAGFQAAYLNEPIPAPPQQHIVLLQELKQERRPLYDERTGLHAQLEVVDSDAERLALAGRILGLSKQINAHWETVRYVEQHGSRPEPPAAPVAEDLAALAPADLLKRRNNLRSRVSKLKNKPLRADDLAAVQADLVQVEALLSAE